MIPQLVTVRYRGGGGRPRAWHVPALPVLLLITPLVALGGVIACVIYRINPASALLGLGRLLWSLPGAMFALDDGHTALSVTVR